LYRKKEMQHLEKAVDLYNQELVNELNEKHIQIEEYPEDNIKHENDLHNTPNEKLPPDEVNEKAQK